jgi:hypothetical protein
MNLRGIANSLTSVINPNIVADYLPFGGYTVDPLTLQQVPYYSTAITGPIQVQALDGEDLKQMDGVNIQGKIKSAYLFGELSAVSRPNQLGGDKLIFDSKTWLVVKVLEGWSDYWTKVAIVLQDD